MKQRNSAEYGTRGLYLLSRRSPAAVLERLGRVFPAAPFPRRGVGPGWPRAAPLIYGTPRMRLGRWSLLGLCAASALVPRPASAQPLAPEGQPIQTSEYAIDLTQSTVLSSARVLGLAGAFVAMAEGADGDSVNPAASGVRAAHSYLADDFEFGGGLSLPGSLGHTGDYFNSGQKTRVTTGNDVYVFLNLQYNMQIDRWGFAATADLQQYSLRLRGSTDEHDPANLLTSQIILNHAQVARAVDDGQLAIGAGLRVLTLNVTTRPTPVSEGNNIFVTAGLGGEVGFVWRPNDERVRVGGAFRSTVTASATPNSGTSVISGGRSALYLPEDVTLPWDLSVGAALQLGDRPLNPRWINPERIVAHTRRYIQWRIRERERLTRTELERARHEGRDLEALREALEAENEAEAELDRATLKRIRKQVEDQLYARTLAQSRFSLLLMTTLVLTGEVGNGVGVESFLNRRVQRSGERATLSPRIGVEFEPIPHWMQARTGFYFEPTRFSKNADGTPSRGRAHATLGLDVKVLKWNVFHTFPDYNWFRIVGAIDVAREYFNWGLSIGVWH
ncbi:MAG TPA: hypothetical protein VGK73_00125 [Polyangiaceae bacterium]